MWGGLCCRCGVGACRRCPSSAIAFWVRRRAPSVLSRRGRRVRAVPRAPCGLVIDNVSSRRAAGAACRRSRLVLSRGRECCPRGVFAPCPLEFGGVRRAPCRGPARLSPRPPCCSPALSFLCTRAHFTPIKLTAHQAVAGLAILQGSAAGGPVCYPSAMPAGPAGRQWPLMHVGVDDMHQ